MSEEKIRELEQTIRELQQEILQLRQDLNVTTDQTGGNTERITWLENQLSELIKLLRGENQ
ncbi:MAG: hypothetical protein Fur006_69570 [Coleofasciculaceae cyanobacterium]